MVAMMCAACPVGAFILTAVCLPESPMWLLRQGKYEEAKKSLLLLRATRNPDVIQHELNDMQQQTKQNKTKQSTWNAIKNITRPEYYKPLILMNTFFLFQQLSGIFVVIFYAVSRYSCFF